MYILSVEKVQVTMVIKILTTLIYNALLPVYVNFILFKNKRSRKFKIFDWKNYN
jgi:hypothetical protein